MQPADALASSSCSHSRLPVCFKLEVVDCGGLFGILDLRREFRIPSIVHSHSYFSGRSRPQGSLRQTFASCKRPAGLYPSKFEKQSKQRFVSHVDIRSSKLQT